MSWTTHVLSRIAAASLALAVLAGVARPSQAADGDDMVFVEAHTGLDGETIEGYWRDASREGLTWVDPYVDDDGTNVPGFWQPNEERPGYVYEWGWRDDNAYFYPGFWREVARDGYEWVGGYYDNGTWVNGDWRPIEGTRAGYTWAPGYANTDGYWASGHWREQSRDGYSWVDPYYADQSYYAGYWSPYDTRPGEVWVPGYAVDGHWNDGYWRPSYRDGYTWAAAYWLGSLFMPARWHHGAWNAPYGYRQAHYASYDWSYGHNYRSSHHRVQRPRYVSHNYRPTTARPRHSSGPRQQYAGRTSQGRHDAGRPSRPGRPSGGGGFQPSVASGAPVGGW